MTMKKKKTTGKKCPKLAKAKKPSLPWLCTSTSTFINKNGDFEMINPDEVEKMSIQEWLDQSKNHHAIAVYFTENGAVAISDSHAPDEPDESPVEVERHRLMLLAAIAMTDPYLAYELGYLSWCLFAHAPLDTDMLEQKVIDSLPEWLTESYERICFAFSGETEMKKECTIPHKPTKQ